MDFLLSVTKDNDDRMLKHLSMTNRVSNAFFLEAALCGEPGRLSFVAADGTFQEIESLEVVKQGDVLASRMRSTGMLSFIGSTF